MIIGPAVKLFVALSELQNNASLGATLSAGAENGHAPLSTCQSAPAAKTSSE